MLEVQFVGTGDAFGSGGRRFSAILVRSATGTVLLDCGPTTLAGLQELGVDPLDIDAICLSHFHGDHAAGIPFFLIDFQYNHVRKRPFSVVGPPGIEARTRLLVESFSYDTPEDVPFEVEYRELDCERPLDVAGLSVAACPAYHHASSRPHMLRVDDGSKSLFFTGDTGWHEELPERVGDVDLLISECSQMEPKFEFHLSSVGLDRMRDRFRCARAILTHLGADVLENLDSVPFDTAEDGLRLRI